MATTTTLLASDFNTDTTDTRRRNWTVGTMRHVIAALQGAPVALVTDNMTGHTQFNVTLDKLRTTPGYGTFQVLITDRDTDAADLPSVWTSLDSLGEAITVLPSSYGQPGYDAKWHALTTLRLEDRAAVQWVRTREGIEPGGHYADPDTDTACSWHSRHLLTAVHVSAKVVTHRNGTKSSRQAAWWQVPLADIACTRNRRSECAEQCHCHLDHTYTGPIGVG